MGWCSEVQAAAAAKSLQLCPTLCDPIDSSPPGSAIPGILQATTLWFPKQCTLKSLEGCDHIACQAHCQLLLSRGRGGRPRLCYFQCPVWSSRRHNCSQNWQNLSEKGEHGANLNPSAGGTAGGNDKR